jgi:hypothetical protein
LHQLCPGFGWLAGNCRFGHSSGARPEGALIPSSCNNVGEAKQPNKSKISQSMRAKGRPTYQTRP